MKTCVFAGTFDPFTVGHKAVIDKILRSGRRVIITVGNNPEKEPYFTANERAEIIKAAYKGNSKVRVVVYSDHRKYVELLTSLKVSEYYRGIRSGADYEFERAKEKENRKIYPEIQTVYVFATKYLSVSSSAVKERLFQGKDVKRYIPKKAYKTFKRISDQKNKGN